MKKIILIMGILMILLLIAACSNEKKTTKETDTEDFSKDAINADEPEDTEKYKEVSPFDIDQVQNEEQSEEKESEQKDETNSFDIDKTNEISEVTNEELAMHATEDDCWISYEGAVYDVTEFLPKHPGSAAAIIPYCGTNEDFAFAFEGQHGTSKVDILTKEGEYKGDLE